MHLAQFCWFLFFFFFFLIVMQLCRLIYTYVCMYMYMQTYNCLLSIDCFCFSICLFSTILIILCLSEIEQNTTLVFLPDRLKVHFVLLMDFEKNNNQYPFIMQHELHWNRKIRLSQSINEAKHLLCVNARAKERVSEWVSVSQPVQNLVDVNEYYFVGHNDWQVDRRSMSLLGGTFHNKQRRMLLTQHVLY